MSIWMFLSDKDVHDFTTEDVQHALKPSTYVHAMYHLNSNRHNPRLVVYNDRQIYQIAVDSAPEFKQWDIAAILQAQQL